MKTSKRKSTAGSMLVDLAGRTLLVAAAFALLGAGTVNAQLIFDANDTSQFGGWAKIGQPGNADDEVIDYASGKGGELQFGGVPYEYHIAKHAVSIADWQAMVDDTGKDPSNNYDAWNDGSSGNLGTGAPATYVSMHAAAAYANWLTSGDPLNGAYQFDAGVVTNINRAAAMSTYDVFYALPTEDEWYKAAYYSLDESSVGSEVYYPLATTNLVEKSGKFGDMAPAAGDSLSQRSRNQ